MKHNHCDCLASAIEKLRVMEAWAGEGPRPELDEFEAEAVLAALNEI